MEQVNTLIIGAAVVTMNERFEVIRDGAVAVRDGKIVAVGPRDQMVAAYEAGETVECPGQYLLPGLVNAHTHAPMTLLRGLAWLCKMDLLRVVE